MISPYRVAEIIAGVNKAFPAGNTELLLRTLSIAYKEDDLICEYCGEEESSCPGRTYEGHRAIWTKFDVANFIRIGLGS